MKLKTNPNPVLKVRTRLLLQCLAKRGERRLLFGLVSTLLLGLLLPLGAAEQVSNPSVTVSAPVEVERGAHYKILKRTTQRVLPSGRVQTDESTIQKLAVGMHFRQQNEAGEWEWADSKELVEPYVNGAIARFGQVKVAFAANPHTAGALQVVTESGEVLTSQILGLAYTSAATGQSLLIAEVRDCLGEILPPRCVVYRNFLDDVLADLVLTYTRFGLEADIRILEKLPAPEQFGLDSRAVRLEVLTEFLNPPTPSRWTQVLDSTIDGNQFQAMAYPQFTDETLNFSSVRFVPGKTFDLNGEEISAPIGKSWTHTPDRRTVLVEAVEYEAIRQALARLPDRQGTIQRPKRQRQAEEMIASGKSSPGRKFPSSPKAAKAADARPMAKMARTAKLESRRNGVTLDYLLELNSGFTNYTLLPEVTYWIEGPCTFYGTTTIRGGSICKFDHTSANPYLDFSGTIVCDTSPILPAIFTGMDDLSIGAWVWDDPFSGYYAVAALRCLTNVTGELHDLRIKNAVTAIKWTGSTNRFYNLQLIDCSNGVERISASVAPVHNILASKVKNLFLGNNVTFEAEHVTASEVSSLLNLSGSPAALALTNTVLASVTNYGSGTLAADYIGTYNSFTVTGLVHSFSGSLPVFQSSVGGNFYLPNTSPFLGVGAANIATNLAAELAQLTTYAPLYLTNTVKATLTQLSILATLAR